MDLATGLVTSLGYRKLDVQMPQQWSAAQPFNAGGNIEVVGGVLVAGIASRLEPISGVIAKPMFPVMGSGPICEKWLSMLRDNGISKLGMNLFKVPESVTGYYGDGSAHCVSITYVEEPTPSGTLGGVIKIMNAMKKVAPNFDTIVVPSGDVMSEMSNEDFRAMVNLHRKSGAAATLMLTPVPWDMLSEFGVANLKGFSVEKGKTLPNGTYGNITEFWEKVADAPSNLNNASCYVFSRAFLEDIESHLTPCDKELKEPFYDCGKHLFPGMLGKVAHLQFLGKYKEGLCGYVSTAKWFDVGRKPDYLEVNKAALAGEISVHCPFSKRPWGYIGANVDIAEGVRIIGPVVIGNNCTILPGAIIGPNVVLGDGWTVGARAEVSNTVTWKHWSHSNLAKTRMIESGKKVKNSILVAGHIDRDLDEMVVDLEPNGKIRVTSIHEVPKGPRA